MPATKPKMDELFEYNSRHKVLICRQCRYAIQKNALNSHLLRHRIYRGDRQRLLSSIAQYDLLEPQDVVLPPPGSLPVDSLPILSGLRCIAAGCSHLAVSTKRMRRHWSEYHDLDGSIPLSSSMIRAAKLQTFFRGTKISYFEVASLSTQEVNAFEDDDGRDRDNEQADGQAEDFGASAMITDSPQPPQHMPSMINIVNEQPIADFDLGTLTYFHHFMTKTSFTLPGTTKPRSSEHYWKECVVVRALELRWLMCGLLVIAAHHLSLVTENQTTRQMHREREIKFSSEFIVGYRKATKSDAGVEVGESEVEMKGPGKQIWCLLRCINWTPSDSIIEHDWSATDQLISFLSAVRGCVNSESTLRCHAFQCDDCGSRAELVTQEVLQDGSAAFTDSQKHALRQNVPARVVDLLNMLPSRMAEAFGRPEDVQDVFATMSALNTLAECCDISFANSGSQTAWQGVVNWLANVPAHFYQMVSRQQPAALVLLAHWAAILVSRAEASGCWIIRGSARNVLRQVTEELSPHGRVVLDLVENLAGVMNL